MSFLHENGWLLFLVSEGLTWILIAFFFYCRYWLRYDRLSQLWLILIVFINIFQILLGGIDFYITGEISFFQIFIVLFITYATTLGKSDFQRLDQFIKEKIHATSKRIDRITELEELRQYLPFRLNLFALHTIAFVLIHYFWLLLDVSVGDKWTNFITVYSSSWFQPITSTFFGNSIFVIISYVWSIIYLFDLIVFLVYVGIRLSWIKEGISRK